MSGSVPVPVGSGLTQPRFQVVVNGTALNGGIECEVTHNNHYRASTFTARLAIGADAPAIAGPYSSSLATSGTQPFSAAWWSSQTDAILVNINMGLASGTSAPAWTTVISGEVDDISLDLTGQTVSLTGRDLSRRLIDAKTQESFVNQTSSQIATLLAGRHRLSPNVQATTTPVGAYYQLEHTRLQLGSLHRATTEWNLLVWLAEQEGFDVWISPFTGSGPYDATLNFQLTPQDTTTPALAIYEVQPGGYTTYAQSRVSNLKLERSMGLVKGVIVKVQTWNSKSKSAITKTAGKGGKDTQTFVFTRPNLSPAQCQAYANTLYAQIVKHERKVSFDMPGELLLTTRDIIQLYGTNTEFDQIYYIDSFDRKMSLTRGFTSSFRMKNQSPSLEGATAVQVG